MPEALEGQAWGVTQQLGTVWGAQPGEFSQSNRSRKVGRFFTLYMEAQWPMKKATLRSRRQSRGRAGHSGHSSVCHYQLLEGKRLIGREAGRGAELREWLRCWEGKGKGSESRFLRGKRETEWVLGAMRTDQGRKGGQPRMPNVQGMP